jgi:membrane-bound metal-dependent hydrolase YbcI (DUF457 family)
MFIGHFAVAFAAKRAAPRTSLGTLVAATALVDLIWPVLVLAGVETVRIAPGVTAYNPLDFEHYPWTHSALMAAVWAALFGGAVWFATRDRAGAWVSGLVVASHWVLDLVSHRPDLPLWPGGPKVGLGLWDSVPATIAVEASMFVAAVWLYAAGTRARDRIGRWAFVAFVALFVLSEWMDAQGGAPPSVTALAVVGVIAGGLTIPWAAWFDRHREVRSAEARVAQGASAH